MRLDHLLSKEQLGRLLGLSQCRPDRVLCGSPAAHGWNIDIGIQAKGSGLVRHLRVVGTTGAGGLGACTLLGPEGPDDPATFEGWGDGFFRPSPRSALLVGVGVLAVC